MDLEIFCYLSNQRRKNLSAACIPSSNSHFTTKTLSRADLGEQSIRMIQIVRDK